ncbi:tripartite tricarboxylate transporter TctB family protein [Caenimonas sedimenti]|uniref:Tripartite tricarboxylate transporter TctB family protein n=1 Tax=Caenimonas sedimenti TaxID=2596921 RepID=A0A562ZKN8_9BURK|nr:tripartite tricarboxylate transporter TctB family protein [Caenimonas sedimenti]TWO68981.1 tripartite tricarboxylate transporter TctB family protein [Caenimonas sedimenti]
MHEQPAGEAKSLATNATVDAVVAALLTLVGIVVMVQARKLGAGWASDGPGAGYFPFYIGGLLTVGGVGILYQSLLSKKADKGSFVDAWQMKQILSVLLPSTAFVGVIMVVGMYVAAAIFLACFMVWLGKYSWAKSVTLGIGSSVFFFVLFEIWFKVPLAKGALQPLAFLGY